MKQASSHKKLDCKLPGLFCHLHRLLHHQRQRQLFSTGLLTRQLKAFVTVLAHADSVIFVKAGH